MLKNKTLIIILILILGVGSAKLMDAQTYISSPYSAYGLGNLSDANNVRNKSMGGLGIATRDYFTVNVANPASYTAFDSTSFIFEGSVYANYTVLKNEDFSENIGAATFGHLLMGFPIMKWWKSSVGLIPYSEMGYYVNDKVTHEDIGNTQYIFEGEGGISRAFWGNAVQPLEYLSLGVNVSYMFGTVNRISKVTFPGSTNMISTRRDNILNVHDVDIEFGAQYHSKLKNKYDVVIGATYHPEANLRTKQNTMVRSYKGSVGSIDLIIDTVDQVVNDKGNIVFPETIGFGASIGQGHKWMFGIDYKFEEWENFTSYNIYDSLTNRHSIRFGGHIIPNAVSSSYLNRIDFRAGFRYDISYLYLRNEQLNGFGITFGLGIPVKSNAIRGTRSMINVGFEMGRLGTTSYGLIQENYYNFYLSVSIFERWFVKRRYR